MARSIRLAEMSAADVSRAIQNLNGQDFDSSALRVTRVEDWSPRRGSALNRLH